MLTRVVCKERVPLDAILLSTTQKENYMYPWIYKGDTQIDHYIKWVLLRNPWWWQSFILGSPRAWESNLNRSPSSRPSTWWWHNPIVGFPLSSAFDKSHGALLSALWLAGSFKSEVSFAKEPCKRDYILQKIPVILKSPLIVVTPYPRFTCKKKIGRIPRSYNHCSTLNHQCFWQRQLLHVTRNLTLPQNNCGEGSPATASPSHNYSSPSRLAGASEPSPQLHRCFHYYSLRSSSKLRSLLQGIFTFIMIMGFL
jgi:hypothetical protein